MKFHKHLDDSDNMITPIYLADKTSHTYIVLTSL